MSKGFIKLNRKYFENHFWKEERTYSLAEAWLDLIQSARFEVAPEKLIVKMKVVTINRGELRASQRYLANRWKWSIGKTNRFIKLLQDEQMIVCRREHSETIVSLCKYNDFNPITYNKMNTNEYSNENTNGTPVKQGQIQTKELQELQEREENKKNKQKNILGVYQNFFDEVLKFFSLVSEHHQRNAFGYLVRKIDKDEIKDFAEQTSAMMLYKNQNPKEKRSNWNNYIYDYDSGNSTDWVGKVRSVSDKPKIKPKLNATNPNRK